MKSDTCFWAVDKVVLAYFAFAVVILLGWWSRIPEAPSLLAANLLGGALIVYSAKRPNPATWFFRNWYPLPFVGSCYKEMAFFIPAVRGTDADLALAHLDYRIWGANPTVWLERLHHPVFTEFLQLAYTLFIPAVLWVAWLLWRQQRYSQFQYYAFLIALGFLTSYIGYLLVPARGPRFLLRDLQHFPLDGLWLFHGMQGILDKLESAHYDCFPSGHTELTILAWSGSRMISKRLFRVYFAYTPCIIFATVYLRYHYTVDLLAGGATAVLLILTAPALYKRLSPTKRETLAEREAQGA
ncbi:MAG TPA: phosphatase PAP2 family protein [Candidatus Acidoferrum sp.]|jgi:membrane-associated phospholipid phosphatase|nr:phosphatase PAP2 family protein [Candidatus Acidoferrum sp.]